MWRLFRTRQYKVHIFEPTNPKIWTFLITTLSWRCRAMKSTPRSLSLFRVSVSLYGDVKHRVHNRWRWHTYIPCNTATKQSSFELLLLFFGLIVISKAIEKLSDLGINRRLGEQIAGLNLSILVIKYFNSTFYTSKNDREAPAIEELRSHCQG